MAAMALVDWLPELIVLYRERYRARNVRTSRELSRFFLPLVDCDRNVEEPARTDTLTQTSYQAVLP